MGDISQKNLKRYDGKNLTIIWRTFQRTNNSDACRRGVKITSHQNRDVYRSDIRVYHNKLIKGPQPGAKRFVKRAHVHDGDHPYRVILNMFNANGEDLWWVRGYDYSGVLSRKCGDSMVKLAYHFMEDRQTGCIHVDRFLATVSNNDVYLRASIRACTSGELMKYAAMSPRGENIPFYRRTYYSTRITKRTRLLWPSLKRVWKKGRLISQRAIK